MNIYFISAIGVTKNSQIILKMLKVNAKYQVESSYVSEENVIKLAERGELVVGVNEKASTNWNYGKYSREMAKVLKSINPKISKQIPVANSKNNYRTAIYLERVNQQIYRAITVDMYNKVEQVVIDVTKRGYTNIAWNVRHATDGEKLLEIVGYKTALNRYTKLRQQREMQTTVKQEKDKINLNEGNQPRFWAVGIDCEIHNPQGDIATKVLNREIEEKSGFIGDMGILVNFNDIRIKVVDLHARAGDGFKVLSLTHDEIQYLSLYEEIGNVFDFSLEQLTGRSNEWIVNYGVEGAFKNKLDMLHDEVDYTYKPGITVGEIYSQLLSVKKDKIDSMCVCIYITEAIFERGMRRLSLLNCDGIIKKVTADANDKRLKQVGRLLNVSNIFTGTYGTEQDIVNHIRCKRDVSAIREIEEVRKAKNTCGICIGKVEQVEDKSMRAKAYFYDKIYDIEIVGYSREMSRLEIERDVIFNVIDCKINDIAKYYAEFAYLKPSGNEDIQEAFIGLFTKGGYCVGCKIKRA